MIIITTNTMTPLKYEYRELGTTTSAAPCAHLMEGQTGILYRVDFFKRKDYLRDEDFFERNGLSIINIGLDAGFLQRALGAQSVKDFTTLEDLTNRQLEILTITLLERGKQEGYHLLLSELKQLRELEQVLKINVGDYRGK